MKLELIKASEEYREQIADMLDEWSASGEKIFPYTIRRADYNDFQMYMSSLEATDTGGGSVNDSTYFCFDADRNIIVGAVSIRHHLSEALILNDGHITAGVRPTERRKGIGTRMTALALDECRRLGMDKTLIVCDKGNAAFD